MIHEATKVRTQHPESGSQRLEAKPADMLESGRWQGTHVVFLELLIEPNLESPDGRTWFYHLCSEHTEAVDQAGPEPMRNKQHGET